VIPDSYSFLRYLKSKKSVDDRALNRNVWDCMAREIAYLPPGDRLKVFEVGAGIGTMLTRMIEWELFQSAEYTGIDYQQENIEHAQVYMREWAARNGFRISNLIEGFMIEGPNTEVQVNLLHADLFTYLGANPTQSHDLLVANAFLDLVPLPESLQQLFDWGEKEYQYYFSINYDGLTIIEPEIDAGFDKLVLSLYNETMNMRIEDGFQYGDHQTGRHLMNYIHKEGGQILSAGSSDWVVFPGPQGYPKDEAYFLHFIIHTIENALRENKTLDKQQFAKWIDLRHNQIERAELIYIAHQMDYFGNSKTRNA
jgi:hypothetical protein